MFRIIPYRDRMNKDPNKRKKIKWFIVESGYRCRKSYSCPHGSKCKYHSKYTWHNFSVNVSRFIYRKFHVEFHFPIYFQKHGSDLSGTTRCPYEMPRMYDCYDCEYSRGYRECGNEVRHDMIKDGKYSEIQSPSDDYTYSIVCKLFKPNDYCQKYDKKTGEIIIS